MARYFIKLTVYMMFILLSGQAGAAMEKVPVCVSIAPQRYFVQQIGKDLVDVQVMVKPGASPHTYEPKPRQMAGIAKAKIYFAIGVTFEKVWLGKIAAANPKMKVIHTDHEIRKIPIHAHAHAHEDKAHQEKYPHDQEDEHHHDQEDQHHHAADDEHESLDPHIWLSPPLVMIQARTILSALQAVDPENRDVYAANYEAFISGISNLDRRLKQIFAGKQGLQFMVFHPAWGYFANTYGLEQLSIEIEGKAPKPAQLRDLIEHAREANIKIIFVQPQFSRESANLVAKEIGGEVVYADPLAENWSTNMREVADKFKAALK